ncbi:MAG: DUF3124 domain-containing protein [Planctomycetes bacterium]|nr:DUF3124 domain-containing protein [Planctomycetota bacterium]
MIVYAIYLDGRVDAVQKISSPTDLEGDDRPRSDLYHLDANPVEGQTVYVPAYSHVYHGAGAPYLLTITLSVRNTSLDSEISVTSVRYFNTEGREVKSYLDKPVRLPALGTTEVVVDRDDTSGGSGANFLVEWHAARPVTEPIIEAVMISTNAQQGISFARRGSVIKVAVSQGEAAPQPPAEASERSD